MQILESKLVDSQHDAQEAQSHAASLREELAATILQATEAQEASATLAGLYSASKEQLEAERQANDAEKTALRTDEVLLKNQILSLQSKLDESEASNNSHVASLSAVEASLITLSADAEVLRSNLESEQAAHEHTKTVLTDRAAEQVGLMQ